MVGWDGPEPIRRVTLNYPDCHISADFLDGCLAFVWRDRTDKQWVGVQPVALRRQLGHFIGTVQGRNEALPTAAQVEASLALALRARDSAAAMQRPRARSDRPRVAVLGGGVFGATCAIELARDCDVTLFERHESLLKEASYLNQWRHHSGFHYPRSLETIQEVQRTKGEFESLYESVILRDVEAFYAVSAWGSEISAQRYIATCQANGLKFTEVSPPADIVYPDRVSVCLLTDEAVVEIGKLGDLLIKSLKGNRHVDLHLATEVRSGRLLPDGRKQLTVAVGRSPDRGAGVRLPHQCDLREQQSRRFLVRISPSAASLRPAGDGGGRDPQGSTLHDDHPRCAIHQLDERRPR